MLMVVGEKMSLHIEALSHKLCVSGSLPDIYHVAQVTDADGLRLTAIVTDPPHQFSKVTGVLVQPTLVVAL